MVQINNMNNETDVLYLKYIYIFCKIMKRMYSMNVHLNIVFHKHPKTPHPSIPFHIFLNRLQHCVRSPF